MIQREYDEANIKVINFENIGNNHRARFSESVLNVHGADMCLSEVYKGWSRACDPSGENEDIEIVGFGYSQLEQILESLAKNNPQEIRNMGCLYLSTAQADSQENSDEDYFLPAA